MKELSIQGQATDHIWTMEDGPESHPIGLRLDCGDSGVVYLSNDQAEKVVDSLGVHVEKPVTEHDIALKREEIEQVADFLKYRRGEHLYYCGSAAFQAILAKQGDVFERIQSVLEAQLASLMLTYERLKAPSSLEGK